MKSFGTNRRTAIKRCEDQFEDQSVIKVFGNIKMKI